MLEKRQKQSKSVFYLPTTGRRYLLEGLYINSYMGKRGPKPGFNVKRRINTNWSPQLAYAIGLLATDGCLSPPGHLIDLTSNDREQLENFRHCLGVDLSITKKSAGNGRKSLRIQFKNVLFYNFLLSIGLTPAKSRTLGPLKIPSKYFFDFLRGVFDGDGSTYLYWDPRWRSSFMYYFCIASASEKFILWLRREIELRLAIQGHITFSRKRNVCYQLKYAKRDSVKVLRRMYHPAAKGMYLNRKRLKINRMLAIVGEQL